MISIVKITDKDNLPCRYASRLDAFSNGREYVFRPGVNIIVGNNGCGKTTLIRMIADFTFCDIVADAIPDWAKRAKECGAGTRHRTHIDRIISDYNIRCLCSLYFRFECIDDNGREYQQPYFANGHQNEATKEIKL